MDEIDLKDLEIYFKNNIFRFLIIMLSIFLIGCIYAAYIQKPVYTSKTTLVLVGLSDLEGTSITENDITMNSKLVTTYREIAKSRKVLEKVISELNLDESYETLASAIDVTNVNSTEIIQISVTSSTAAHSKEIADALATTFSLEIQDIYNIKNISVLDSANLPVEPSNINYKKQFSTYLAVGFIIAFLIIFLSFYLDNTVKTVEQVESKLALPILGAIPNRGKVKRHGK